MRFSHAGYLNLSDSKHLPLLVGHRGYMLRYPENSLRGLKAALDAGVDYIEFDLQMNADHDLVIIHDDDFRRTSGISQSVFTASTAACREISVHEPARFGDRYLPTPASTLGEALALLASYPEAGAMVEIKQESLDHWGLEKVMDLLIAELVPYRGQCVLISFSADAIEYARQNSPLATGWVLDRYDEAQRARGQALQPDYMMMDYEDLPPGEAPWPEFRRWMLYDIVDPITAIEYAEMGVELIETADVGALREIFSKP